MLNDKLYDYEFIPSYEQRQRVQYGVVLTFREGLSREQVEYYVRRISESASVDSISAVSKFNPEYSSPVFYCP